MLPRSVTGKTLRPENRLCIHLTYSFREKSRNDHEKPCLWFVVPVTLLFLVSLSAFCSATVSSCLLILRNWPSRTNSIVPTILSTESGMKRMNRLSRFEGKALLVANMDTKVWHAQRGRSVQAASRKCGTSSWDTECSRLRHRRVSPCVTDALMTHTVAVSKSRQSHGLE